MNSASTCLLFSADAAWAERITRCLPATLSLRVFGTRRLLENTLERQSAQVLLVD